MTPVEPPYSEFGKGYAYCLGLFIAHEWKYFQMKEDAAKDAAKDGCGYNRATNWFYGAADHLIELEIPTALPDDKKAQIEKFKERCFAFRLCMNGEKCDWSDCADAINEAKDLLREWDEFLNIPCIKGEWQ